MTALDWPGSGPAHDPPAVCDECDEPMVDGADYLWVDQMVATE